MYIRIWSTPIAFLLLASAAYDWSLPIVSQRVHRRISATHPLPGVSAISHFDGMLPFALNKFHRAAIELIFDEETSIPSKVGKFGNKSIEFACTVYETRALSPFRLVTFRGAGFDVFNLLVIPRKSSAPDIPIPILGIDIVVMPGSVLAALDFQPVNAHANRFTGPFYSRLQDIHCKWKDKLPSGGSLPEGASQYFSPFCVWTKFPVSDMHLMSAVKMAYEDIVCAYTDEISKLNPSSLGNETLSIFSESHYPEEGFIEEYLKYRIENDPAKKLLQSAFGKLWTDSILQENVFTRK